MWEEQEKTLPSGLRREHRPAGILRFETSSLQNCERHVSADSSHQVGDKLIIATLGNQGKVSVSSSLKWVTLNSYCEARYLKATRTVPGAGGPR